MCALCLRLANIQSHRHAWLFAQVRGDASVGRAILMSEYPFPIPKLSFQIVVGIAPFVPRCSVANFKVHDFLGSFVYQVVAISGTGFETSAHAGKESGRTLVGIKRWGSSQDVDKFILLGMRMPQR